MSKKQLLAAILKLPIDERIDLLNEVEQRMTDECERLPHETKEFFADLDRRHNAWLKDRSRGIPWEKVKQEMKEVIQQVRTNRGKSTSTRLRKRNSRRRSSNTN